MFYSNFDEFSTYDKFQPFSDMPHQRLYFHDQKLILVVIVILCLAVAMPHSYYGTGMADDDVLLEIRSIHSIIHLHVLHLVSSITPVLGKIVTEHIQSKIQFGYFDFGYIWSRKMKWTNVTQLQNDENFRKLPIFGSF